jgi:sterol desaturase/sphingolipid hydroxylase (fatty acid hydroxylase superfamily)
MNPDLARLLAVLALLALLLVLQWRFAYRGDATLRGMANNLLVALTGSGLLRLLVPVGTVVAALWAEARGIGLFPLIGLEGVPAMLVTLVLMDAAIWAQHVASHKWAWFWRLHRVHHVATRFEVTLGLRFHPLEIVVSLAWKLLLVVAFGLPAAAIVLYETLLALAALWTHADLALPPRVERAVSTVLVTPTWHRVHHSPERDCTDSHYGNLLTVWDRLARTRPATLPADQRHMAIGLEAWRTDADQGWGALLLNPFRRMPPPASNKAPADA